MGGRDGSIRIGESVNRIPDEVLARFDQQPWRQIVAMRDLAAHQYDDLDPRRVWRTVTCDVPALRAYLVDTVIPAVWRAPRHRGLTLAGRPSYGAGMQEPGAARPQRDPSAEDPEPSELRARSREDLHDYEETQAVLVELASEW